MSEDLERRDGKAGEGDLAWLSGRLDRHGGDFANWPEPEEARRARQLVLAEPEARQLWDEAKALDALLADDRKKLDLDLAVSNARIEAAVMAKLPANQIGGGKAGGMRHLFATRMAVGMAAAWFFGIALGAVTSELGFFDQPTVVTVDSLIFGPEEFDLS